MLQEYKDVKNENRNIFIGADSSFEFKVEVVIINFFFKDTV